MAAEQKQSREDIVGARRAGHSKRYTLYYNSECEKADQNLKLLKDEGVRDEDLEILEYLKTPLTRENWQELSDLLDKSDGGGFPRKMIRTKEAGYAESGLADLSLTPAEILDIITAKPQFFQRPVVVDNTTGKAVMGRPPSKVKDVIGKHYTLYYLPECEKADQNLKLLRDAGIGDDDLEIIEYMKTPLTREEWQALSDLLNATKGGDSFPREMVRTKEAGYAESGLADLSLTPAEILDIITEKPQFFQRPVVINNRTNAAVMGRPPSKVNDVLDK